VWGAPQRGGPPHTGGGPEKNDWGVEPQGNLEAPSRGERSPLSGEKQHVGS